MSTATRKTCESCGHTYRPATPHQRLCQVCRGRESVVTNPLEAHTIAVRTMMTIANSPHIDEEVRLRAAEALLESTLPLPRDAGGDEDF